MFTKEELESFAKASESRDYRFDGRFFTAVKTTGIYCRPVCPARPMRKNIEYFRTANEAEKAGYRPCMRCRPEVSPQSPAWIGTSATVRRGISLISKGYHFESDENKFAAKLGVGARHLRRLFVDEIGFTAKQISDSQRLNFARTLIGETQLPITEIALSSGFGSIRRFNDAFLKKFSRKPSEIRKKQNQKESKHVTTLFLRYRPPYDWNSILGFFRGHSVPEVEYITENEYHRFFIDEYTKKPALLIVSHVESKFGLKLEIHQADIRSLFALSQKIRRMFDLDSDPILITKAFSKSKFLSGLYEKNPGLRIPSGWDPFETAVSTILGQLVSTEQAQSLVHQLIQEYGTTYKHTLPTQLQHTFPNAAKLSKHSTLNLKTTNARKQTILELSKRVHQQKIDLSEHCDLVQLRSELQTIKGIGPWSSEFISLRSVGDPDAFPKKDLILARVLKNYPEINDEEIKPWRSYLAMYLWKEFAKVYSKKGAKHAIQKNHEIPHRPINPHRIGNKAAVHRV